MEWLLIFVIQTSLGMAPSRGRDGGARQESAASTL
jgi:hypothetical protein